MIIKFYAKEFVKLLIPGIKFVMDADLSQQSSKPKDIVTSGGFVVPKTVFNRKSHHAYRIVL